MQKLLSSSLIFLSLVFSSCSKSNNSSAGSGTATGTITADIDGNPTTFNNGANARRTHTGNFYSVGFAGYTGSPGSSASIGFGIAGTDSVLTGVYPSNYLDTYTIDRSDIMYYESPTVPYVTSISAPDTCIVTVTSMDAASIQGTFSGLALLNSGANGATATHTITNGKFNVKFSN